MSSVAPSLFALSLPLLRPHVFLMQGRFFFWFFLVFFWFYLLLRHTVSSVAPLPPSLLPP